MLKSEAGRLGGQALLARYGREHLRAIARLGGRPRSLTIVQLRQLQPPDNKGGTLPSALRELKRLYKKLYRERPVALSLEGGG